MASFENVDIYVLTDTPAKDPVEGMVVKVYDAAGTLFFTQAITDAAGLVSIVLPAPASYQLRFYKFQVSVVQPRMIEVLEAPVAPDTNTFDVSAHVFAPPEATDPRLCRCSGFFRSPNGAPARYTDIHIIAKFKPLLFEDDAMTVERIRLKTDELGYMVVDLVRFGEYDVTVEGFEDCLRTIRIPDQPSANFPNLLFPVVDRIVFDPPGPYAVGAGSEVVVTPTVYASDGNVLEGTAIEDVQWSTEDSSIAVVLPTATTLVLRGLSAGTTNLLASRKDTSIIRIPDLPISGVPEPITVT